jgi:hypothetical protein
MGANSQQFKTTLPYFLVFILQGNKHITYLHVRTNPKYHHWNMNVVYSGELSLLLRLMNFYKHQPTYSARAVLAVTYSPCAGFEL